MQSISVRKYVAVILRNHAVGLILYVQVDAALDLSHTQNIGYVLKNHFAKSQFLVVRPQSWQTNDSCFWLLLHISILQNVE